MRTAGAEHRRTHDRDRRLRQRALRVRRDAEERRCLLVHAVARILARGGHIACELAADPHGQMILSTEIRELPLDHGIELLDAEHLVEPAEERDRLLLGERERRRDLQQARQPLRVPGDRELAQRLFKIRPRDTVRRDALAAVHVARRELDVALIARKDLRELRVALLDGRVRAPREPREDHPAAGIAREALCLVHRVLRGLLHCKRRVAVVDARRRPEKDRRMIFLRELERLLDHLIRLRDARRIEARHLCEARERARVLLRLRRDRPRIVGDEHDHAARDAEIREAHERIGRDVQPDLLHRHEGARPRIRRTRRRLEPRLLVRRPLDVHEPVPVLPRDRLEHFRRRRARIAAHEIHACRERAESDGLIAHQIRFLHSPVSPTQNRCARLSCRASRPSRADARLQGTSFHQRFLTQNQAYASIIL